MNMMNIVLNCVVKSICGIQRAIISSDKDEYLEIVKRTTQKTDKGVVKVLHFENGKKIKVTVEEIS